MSSTPLPTSSEDLTPTSTSNSPSVSPVSTDALAADPRKQQDSFQSYLFPALSLIIVFLAIIHTYRVISRRRLRRLHAVGLDSIDLNDDIPDEVVNVKLVRPRLYDVYLDGKELKEFGRDIGWKEIMPLSSHLVHCGDVGLTEPPAHPAYHQRSRVPGDSRQQSHSIFDSVKSAALHGLELVSIHNRRAEHEHQARHNHHTGTSLAASSIPGVSLDCGVSMKPVAEVMILMPLVPRTVDGKQEHWEDEQLHDFAIGIKD